MPASAIEPELSVEAQFYAVAYVELQHDRTEFGFIPFTSIDCFARRYELRGGAYEAFRRAIRAINVIVNEHIEKKRERERKQERRNRGHHD